MLVVDWRKWLPFFRRFDNRVVVDVRRSEAVRARNLAVDVVGKKGKCDVRNIFLGFGMLWIDLVRIELDLAPGLQGLKLLWLIELKLGNRT